METRITIDPQIKKKVFEKFHGRCYYCGRQLTWAEATIDHVIPLAKGGRNVVDNFVISCCECNVMKGDKSVNDFKLFIYSLMANALRFIDRGLYNIDSGEVQFFGERNKDDFTKISQEDVSHMNNLMKIQNSRYRKCVPTQSATAVKQRLSMEDLQSIPIDNPYESNGQIEKEPFEDEEWTNDNTLVEKPFVALVGENSQQSISSEDVYLQNIRSLPEVNEEKVTEIIERIKDEVKAEMHPPTSNFIMIDQPKDEVLIPVISFNLPKGISTDSKIFLNEVKRLIEEENLPTTESLRFYYNRMDNNLISNKQYVKISRELIKKEIINKHKNFRPRAIIINNIVV